MKYEYWLACIRGISGGKKRKLRDCMKSAEAVYYIEETQLNKIEFLNERERNKIMQAKKNGLQEDEFKKMHERGIQFIPYFDDAYPERLREIPDYPYALYLKGKLPEKKIRTAAVIGARKCTPYGEKYAVDFARMLARCGVGVISGMARGVDGMGHRGVLMEKGYTLAVLGSGVDICYPKEHFGLYMDIQEQGGGILSEQPPGTPPLAQNFPARNRIISGMADVVLVMEAGEKSGSLITVDMALEQGKDVYALPGPVNSQLSCGCNRLIRQGAGILLSPQEFAKEWNLSEKSILDIDEKKVKKEKMLESHEKLLYSRLGLYPKNVNQLAEETGMSVQNVIRTLISLELQGYIKEVSKNCYVSEICAG